jgi:hypothetical protein
MVVAGWAAIHRALPGAPVALGWVAVLAGAATALTPFAPDTPLSGLASVVYMPSLPLAIAFRIWRGIALTQTLNRSTGRPGRPSRAPSLRRTSAKQLDACGPAGDRPCIPCLTLPRTHRAADDLSDFDFPARAHRAAVARSDRVRSPASASATLRSDHRSPVPGEDAVRRVLEQRATAIPTVAYRANCWKSVGEPTRRCRSILSLQLDGWSARCHCRHRGWQRARQRVAISWWTCRRGCACATRGMRSRYRHRSERYARRAAVHDRRLAAGRGRDHRAPGVDLEP